MLYQGILTFGFITNVMDPTSLLTIYVQRSNCQFSYLATIYFLVSQSQEFGVRSR